MLAVIPIRRFDLFKSNARLTSKLFVVYRNANIMLSIKA